jgi:uncharacterized membrane protein/drug/metabolite transporter (DMT)-like permease
MDREGDSQSGRPGWNALWLVAGMACFGSATPVARIVGRDLPMWLASGVRVAIAVAVLVPVVVARRTRTGEHRVVEALRGSGRGDLLRLTAMGVIGTFAFTVLMVAGMREAPGSVGAVVMATTPAVTGVGAALFLSERLGARTVAAIVLAVIGVVVVNVTRLGDVGGDAVLLGSALVFGAVCCEATYTLVGKRLSVDLDSLSLTLLAAAIAAVAFAPLAVVDAVDFDWSAPSTGDWLAVAWWGAGTLALGSWLWFQGLRRVAAGTAAPYMGVMPVSALVLSYVLLGESVEWVDLAGMALVLAGLAVTLLGEERPSALVLSTLDRLRSGYWFIPSCFVVGAVAAAIGLIALDRTLQGRALPLWTYAGGPQNASELLTTIASSMITFTGVVFSITIVALQLASSQFSPRVLRNFLRDRVSQVALGLFVATFVFSFTALSAVRVAGHDETFVPVVTVTGAFVLVIASVVTFVQLLHHTAQSMRVVNIIERITKETRASLDDQYPSRPSWVPPEHTPGPSTVVEAPRAGVIADVDLAGLAARAADLQATVEVAAPAGTYVCRGAPLLRVSGSDAADGWAEHLRLDVEPTMRDNAAFGFRQLVDIAERALSPGVNDPTTAVQCLDRLHDLLRSLAHRPMPTRRHAAVDGRARASIPQPGFDDLVHLSFDELRHWGRDSIQVQRRLAEAIDDLVDVTADPARRSVLAAHRPPRVSVVTSMASTG